jgi:hypothetical protein
MAYNPSRFISMTELAIHLGHVDADAPRSELRRVSRRLRTTLNHIEQSCSKKFLRRTGSGKNAPFKVTLVALRKHCPDLFDKRDEVLEAVRLVRDELKADIDELKQEVIRNDIAVKSRLSKLERVNARGPSGS